jgi:hypothetical protein
LSDKYQIEKAFLFIGYKKGNETSRASSTKEKNCEKIPTTTGLKVQPTLFGIAKYDMTQAKVDKVMER